VWLAFWLSGLELIVALVVLLLIGLSVLILVTVTLCAFAWWIEDLVAYSRTHELFDPDGEENDVRAYGHPTEG
jgi:hypothetical protein